MGCSKTLAIPKISVLRAILKSNHVGYAATNESFSFELRGLSISALRHANYIAWNRKMALVSGEKFFARVQARAKDPNARALPGTLKCAECTTPLQESLTGCRRLGNGKHVCSDCYFEISNKLEQYPVLTPRIRRGR